MQRRAGTFPCADRARVSQPGPRAAPRGAGSPGQAASASTSSRAPTVTSASRDTLRSVAQHSYSNDLDMYLIFRLTRTMFLDAVHASVMVTRTNVKWPQDL